jgi:hypothetical protein
MMVAPSFPQLRDSTQRTFLELVRRAGILVRWIKSEHTAILLGGRTVTFKSGKDPEALRGPNLGWGFL